MEIKLNQLPSSNAASRSSGQTVSPPREVFHVLRTLRTDFNTSLVAWLCVGGVGHEPSLKGEGGRSEEDVEGVGQPAEEPEVDGVLSRSL
jgi:hypothetical protein